MAKAAILMGSKSDFPVVKPAVKVLKDFGAEVEVRVISAHRTPEEAHEFASKAKSNGVEVIICAAGKAAHLGGVIAAYTTLPVIGLPVKTDMMGGLDSLLSIVQMPSGIPVATVGVNGRRKRRTARIADSGHKVPRNSRKARRIQKVYAGEDKRRRRRIAGRTRRHLIDYPQKAAGKISFLAFFCRFRGD